MPNFEIRAARSGDAAGVVALRAEIHPYLVRGEHATRHTITAPPTAEQWGCFVAVRAGEVVGWVAGLRNLGSAEPDFGQILQLQVHPSYRCRGIGGALFTAVTDHLRSIGIRRTAALTTPEALDFARRRGLEPTREVRYSALDLSPLVSPPVPPVGIRLVPLIDISAHDLYAADRLATADEPGDTPTAPIPFDSWRQDVWDNPDLDRSASTVAMAGDDPIGYSLILRDGHRAWSDMTATVPAFRGRGVALAAKTAALLRAAEHGVTVAYTANDESNVAMLAVNARLGYRPIARQFSGVITL
ncbi:GNAT family N-acetyltransferase [Actinoplanes sp. NBRC 101535]|uniref:GNAT family N-acetyltransferase n=1 Tax=Actinoplanes sp. NBRC 101535 TaxID=3032196 RepID=UPI0024A07793|nr:GNAT family N-acetyltransferase [Actinoplanes sp. NBRC 101535]GLY08040.1 hypothetical protein Acsp01_84190 [Actinoplanes sp. NBRC 101535]